MSRDKKTSVYVVTIQFLARAWLVPASQFEGHHNQNDKRNVADLSWVNSEDSNESHSWKKQQVAGLSRKMWNDIIIIHFSPQSWACAQRWKQKDNITQEHKKTANTLSFWCKFWSWSILPSELLSHLVMQATCSWSHCNLIAILFTLSLKSLQVKLSP